MNAEQLTTPADVLAMHKAQLLIRIREAEETEAARVSEAERRVSEALRQHDMATLTQIKGTRAKHIHWDDFRASPAGRSLDAILTDEQRTRIEGLFDRADDCWSRIETALEAGLAAPTEIHARITEAATPFHDYNRYLADATRFLRDILKLARAGQPTHRVGKGYVPTRVVERVVERDELGRIRKVVERAQTSGALEGAE